MEKSKYILPITAVTISVITLRYLWKIYKDNQIYSSVCDKENEKDIFPPMPAIIVDILRASKLCFLATSSCGDPHLSLMNFTYYQEEESIIISTRRDTKKFTQIVSNPKIAVLIHDFPHLDSPSSDNSHGKSFSITMNGMSHVITNPLLDQKYRAIHLKNNPDYGQFILGEEIAIIILRIEKARMCDINDRVSYWDSKSTAQSN